MLAFVHIEKTAGITLNRILRRSFGIHHCDVEPLRKRNEYFSKDDFYYVKRLYPTLESIAGHWVKPYSDLEEVCPDIQYYTFFRDPITRCASHYQYQIQRMGKRITFDEWIANEEFHNFQTKKIAGEANLEHALNILHEKFFFVGLLERFDESLIIFRRKLDDKRLNLYYRHANVAPSNNIKSELLNTPHTRAQLVEANHVDSALYKQVTQHLYPHQVKWYGKSLDSDVKTFQAENRLSGLNSNALANVLKRNVLYKPLLGFYRLMKL